MPYETIVYSEEDHIGLLTLNRPETLNALNRKMIEELDTLLDELYRDDSARVLIVTGGGEKGFCSGMDMQESAAQLFEASPAMIYTYQNLGVGSLEQALHLENRNQAFLIAGMKLNA